MINFNKIKDLIGFLGRDKRGILAIVINFFKLCWELCFLLVSNFKNIIKKKLISISSCLLISLS